MLAVHPVLYCGSILIDSIYILRDYFTGIWDLRLPHCQWSNLEHYSDVIMGTMASQVTSLTIVYSTVYLGTDQRKHQSLASLALVRGIHRSPVNSPHKGPVTRKMFPFHHVIPQHNQTMYTHFAIYCTHVTLCMISWNFQRFICQEINYTEHLISSHLHCLGKLWSVPVVIYWVYSKSHKYAHDYVVLCLVVGRLLAPSDSWWRHQMETFFVLLSLCAGNSPVIGEFPAQRQVTRSFDVFFGQCLNKRLCKQSWGWWPETPSRPLWRHCNGYNSPGYSGGIQKNMDKSIPN